MFITFISGYSVILINFKRYCISPKSNENRLAILKASQQGDLDDEIVIKAIIARNNMYTTEASTASMSQPSLLNSTSLSTNQKIRSGYIRPIGVTSNDELIDLSVELRETNDSRYRPVILSKNLVVNDLTEQVPVDNVMNNKNLIQSEYEVV